MTNDCSKALHNKLQTDVAMMDIIKAFGVVPHYTLIHILDFYCILGLGHK